MTRPFYETDSDLANERAVAVEAGAAWGCEFVKLKRAYVADYAMVRGRKIVAFAEIKCRNYSMERLDSLGGFMLSLHKLIDAKSICVASGVPFVAIVKTTDGVWHHTTNDFLNDGVALGGRSDRDDPQDVEPVALFRASRFRKLATRSA